MQNEHVHHGRVGVSARLHRIGRAMAGLMLLPLACLASDAAADASLPVPSAVFAQVGVAQDADAVATGGLWDWSWRLDRRWGSVTGYLEVSLGHWRNRDDGGGATSGEVTQFGVTPVVQLHPRATPGWFFEAGIGGHLLAPPYRNGDKRFSTKFNFGDHVAVGHRFGARREHALSLRLQHFSNAGIEHPNPGEDFLQLRYLRRF